MKKLAAAADRLLNFLLSLDIRIKIIGLAVGSVLLFGTVTTVYMYSTISRNIDDAFLSSILREQLLVTGTVAIAVLAVAFLLGSYISAQIKALVQAARIVAGEDIGYQVKVYRHDEFGLLAQAFNTMSTKLVRMRNKLEQREAMRRQLLVKLIRAQEEERLRVARELHDNLGGSLASLGYGLQSVSLVLDSDPANVKHIVRSLCEENLSVQNELRAIIYALRPSVLDDLGLIPALRSYVEHCVVAKGIDVDFNIEGEARRLPSEIETALFRITQEALNNILRHAVAHKVQVHAKFLAEGVDLTIIDDGCGFDASELQAKADGRAIGLMGMHERAELLDGQLEIASKPGQGCRIRVYIPTI